MEPTKYFAKRAFASYDTENTLVSYQEGDQVFPENFNSKKVFDYNIEQGFICTSDFSSLPVEKEVTSIRTQIERLLYMINESLNKEIIIESIKDLILPMFTTTDTSVKVAKEEIKPELKSAPVNPNTFASAVTVNDVLAGAIATNSPDESVLIITSNKTGDLIDLTPKANKPKINQTKAK